MNASVREADGASGLPAEAPFDVIVLSGSVAEVPPALLGAAQARRPAGRRSSASEPVMRAAPRHPQRRRTRCAERRPVRHRGAAPARLRRAEPRSRF